MRNSRRQSRGFVVCIDNSGYPASLELRKLYRVVPDAKAAADGDIRVVDESGEDYLYPASRFAPRIALATLRRQSSPACLL